MYGLVFNLKNPLFQDKKIRQAINYGIDKRSIISGMLYGMGRECWGPIPPESWAYNVKLKKYPFDPDKAMQLLSEAGWHDNDNDGIREKNGLALEFTMLSHQNESIQQMITIIQQQLKPIGIRMKIKIVEWSVYLNTFVAKRNFDMCVTRGAESVLTPDLSFEFHSSQIHDTEYNWANYINPELDRLIEKSLTTFDQEKQKQYLYQAQEIISEDVPVIYLFMRNSMVATNKRVHGPKPLISPLGFDYNLDWWWIPKQLQFK